MGRETEPIIISRAGSALTPLHPTDSREKEKKQKKQKKTNLLQRDVELLAHLVVHYGKVVQLLMMGRVVLPDGGRRRRRE